MKDGYRDWLSANFKPNTVTTQLSQARRLEREFGDLDEHYDRDGFASLLAQLRYSAADERAGKPSPTSLVGGETNVRTALAHLRGALSFYRRFREGGAVADASQWPELDRMRRTFLARCQDFQDFEQDHGTYFDVERAYKNEVLAKFERLLAQAEGLSDRELGQRALVLLEEKPSNFVSWRTFSAVKDAGADGAGGVAEALGEMLRSKNDVAEAAARAAQRIEPHLPPRNFGMIRSLVTAALAFTRPDEAVFIKTQIMQRAARELTGERLFRQQVMDAAEYRRCLDLMRRIEGVMRDDWDWKPWDLWDVQGFLWVAMNENWDDDADASEDVAVVTMESGGPGPDRQPLNQIFYGPPGTGKTWLTAKVAVEICNGSAPPDRAALMAEYERLRAAKRIALATFHQSLGYEEFVEGLRPVTESETDTEATVSGGFRLEPHHGIFREICALAEQARTRTTGPASIDLTGRQFFKMSLGRADGESHIYEAAIDGGFVVLGWGGEVDWSSSEYGRYDAILQRWQEVDPGSGGKTGNVAQVYRFRATMRKGDIVIISEGNKLFRAIGEVTGDYEFHPEDKEFSDERTYNHRRSVRWLRVLKESLPVSTIYEQQFSMASCYPLRRDKLNLPALAELLGDGPAAPQGEPSRYVLILDEINRANVSKVLGELITLIEPDKRLGRENELKVVLPYSKDTFGIPDNLHIIGTMNTADRSIAMLDTALRRRFDFVEMMPDYAVINREVEGVHLGRLLEAINRRIEWLFDREHQIGHAYLTGVRTKRELDEAMRRRIIPLLTEYFYEDWEKVRAALNDAEGRFIRRDDLKPPAMSGEGEEPRPRYAVQAGPFPIEGYRTAIG